MPALIRSTRAKIRLASIAYSLIRLLRLRSQRVIVRQGVRWDVDLAEGIDLSLFLLGGFQRHVTDERWFRLPEEAVIFDVGANIGSIAIPLAARHPGATVYAFEPTDFAWRKLLRNLELNEPLRSRVVPVQAFVSSSCSQASALTAYSSWTVDDLGGARHPVHLGLRKAATRRQITLDRFVAERDVERLDLLKIDTDGHELGVLQGALTCLRRFRPVVIFEMTRYLLEENGETFADYEHLLGALGYRLCDARSGREVRSANVERLIPRGGGIDIVALPGSPDAGDGERPLAG